VYTCNPSYSGGRGRRISSWRLKVKPREALSQKQNPKAKGPGPWLKPWSPCSFPVLGKEKENHGRELGNSHKPAVDPQHPKKGKSRKADPSSSYLFIFGNTGV
jgi:hypothetical protein